MKRTTLYRITGPAGKRYIGITSESIHRRFLRHCSFDSCIGRAIRKHGRECFQVEALAVGTRTYVSDLEKRAIEVFKTRIPNGYNVSPGGERGGPGPCTEEARAKISAANRGRKRTGRALQNIREANPKRVFTPEGLARMRNARTGTRQTDETKAKIGAAQRGMKRSPETRKKQSEARKRWWAKRRARDDLNQ